MAPSLVCTRTRGNQSSLKRTLWWLKRYLLLIFYCGPKVLLTSQISGRCALIMVVMLAPSLLCSFLLTVPGWVFQSPHQQAYFHFSHVLNEDPTRWIVLGLAGLCALLSLAVPATTADPGRHRY